MAAMAAGDQAALFPFLDEFGDRLGGMVRAVFRSVHRHDLASDPNEVDYHVQTAALVLFDRAAGWDPDGALPWTWANRAIRAAIIDRIGHPSVELLEVDLDLRTPGGGAAAAAGAVADVDFDEMATTYPLVVLVVRAVRSVANERDAAVHLEYQAQKSMGDRQPAHPVGDMFDLTPANVRKIDQRVRAKLSALAASDPAFAALARVAWVEAC